MKTIKKVIDALCSGFMIVVVSVMFLEVISRYILNLSLPWPGEVSRYLFIWIVMLGSFSALVDGEHFEVEFLVERLPDRVRVVASVFARIVVALVVIVLIRYGYILSVKVHGQLSAAMQIPMSLVYISVPVASLLMLISILWGGIADISRAIARRRDQDYGNH
jgi:TRAP-type C4-dicarboxylate transport system permease small subunit